MSSCHASLAAPGGTHRVVRIAALAWFLAAAVSVFAADETDGGRVDPNQTADPNQPERTAAPAALAVLRIQGLITEAPGLSMLSLASGEGSSSIIDLQQTLQRAGEDASLAGLIVSIENPSIGWAQVSELRSAIAQLRRQGKKAYAYAESLDQGTYLLATACDSICLTPTGYVMLTGLSGQSIYFKGLFDMLGLKADFIQMGDYKGAAEPFTRTEPSEFERRQMDEIFDSLFDEFIQTICRGRDLNRPRVEELIDNGPYTARAAREAGLIDRVLYRDDFLDYLAEQNGAPVDLRTDYNQPRQIPAKLDNPFALMGILQEMLTGPPEPPGDAIAICYINGPIMDGDSVEDLFGSVIGSRTIRLALDRAQNNPDIKALVLRIDSPGGSATASDIIYRAIGKLAETKPVIVSMGDVAASGGYYIACGAPMILAEPTTITGSIGVVGGKFVFGGLLDKIGISSYAYRRGQNAGLFSLTEPFSPQQRLRITRMMRETYDIFLQRVDQSRGEKLQEPLADLAQGRIYTGARALELGLIDQLGGLQDAIRLAARQANIETYNLRTVPRPKGLLEILETLLAQSEAPEPTYAFLQRQAPTGAVTPWLAAAGPRSLQRILFHGWQLMQLLQRQEPVLFMPWELHIEW
ncbi:MAG: signal peptide peptidase SppA [Sedimentisphaerales bacterium]|nr:signal peptide peptidase SppA [Sedimentisphaerales bacterium]